MQTIWLAGDGQHPHFAEALAWLGEHANLIPLPAEGAAAPSAILIAQSRPGQFSRAAVEAWHARAPLARLVALVGPWCEGEQRSGRPWPGVVRVPWRDWPARLPRALGLVASDVRLPRTASDAERLQSEIASLGLSRRPQRAGGVAIRSASAASHEGLCSLLTCLGASVVADNAALEIVEGWDQWPTTDGPPRVLLLHFPRPDDLDRARQRDAAAVLAQPLLLADLAAVLDRLLPQVDAARRVASVA